MPWSPMTGQFAGAGLGLAAAAGGVFFGGCGGGEEGDEGDGEQVRKSGHFGWMVGEECRLVSWVVVVACCAGVEKMG